MNIPIDTAKRIREELKALSLVILTVDEDGQHLATHGESADNANAAAAMGNLIKKFCGWPEGSCRSTPLPRTCQNCDYWKQKIPRTILQPCEHPSIGNETTDGIFEEGMKYYHEGIRTGPDFGCIHFTPRP